MKKNLSILAILFLYNITSILAQDKERVNIHERNFKPLEIKDNIKEKTRNETAGRANATNERDRAATSRTNQPAAPATPKSSSMWDAIPSPGQITNHTAGGMIRVTTVMKQMQSVKTILVGSILVGLVSTDAKDFVANNLNQLNAVKTQEWKDLGSGLKNIDAIKVHLLHRIATDTMLELDEARTKFGNAGNAAASKQCTLEYNFWNKFADGLSSSY